MLNTYNTLYKSATFNLIFSFQIQSKKHTSNEEKMVGGAKFAPTEDE